MKEKAIGEAVETTVTDKSGRRSVKVTPGDHFIKICHDELEALMGPGDTSLKFKPKGGPDRHHDGRPPGLRQDDHRRQARALAARRRARKPLLVAADIYRPAAVEQLKVLGEQLGVPVFNDAGRDAAGDLRSRRVEARASQKRDVIIYDTAGRLAIDEPLMQELEEIKAARRAGRTSSSSSTR